MTTNPASPLSESTARHVRRALEDLPSPDTRRWVVRRKAKVVSAVREGVLTIEEACRRYGLSVEELHAWEQGLTRHGLRGLQATRVGQYRVRLAAALDERPPGPVKSR